MVPIQGAILKKGEYKKKLVVMSYIFDSSSPALTLAFLASISSADKSEAGPEGRGGGGGGGTTLDIGLGPGPPVQFQSCKTKRLC